MCLNGKCVYEHENEVDYDGFGFLRRSGKITDDKLIETPSEKRYGNVEIGTMYIFLVNGDILQKQAATLVESYSYE